MTVHLTDRRHPAHELAWLAQGSVTVRIDGHRWTVSPTQALWIPAGVVHEVEIADGTLITPYWFPPHLVADAWGRPTALAVDAATGREMARITQLWLSQMLDGEQATEAMLRVLPDLRRRASGLALPQTDPAREVGAAILDRPSDVRTLEQWAAHVHVGARTLRRAFVAETGMRFVDWRATARIFASLPMLAAGEQVGVVAHRVGYTSANGYITAFRKYLGTTPGRFGAVGTVPVE